MAKSAKTRKTKKASTASKAGAVQKALGGLGLNVPDLSFVERNSLSAGQAVNIHEIDRTPLVLDPGLGTGGVRAICFASDGLDVGGKSVTDNTGKRDWKLSDFICVDKINTAEPVSFVATARSQTPEFLTFRTVSTGDDLEIEVFSWDVSGNPAPRVAFSWRCWTNTPPFNEP